jgi:hypothetical protein
MPNRRETLAHGVEQANCGQQHQALVSVGPVAKQKAGDRIVKAIISTCGTVMYTSASKRGLGWLVEKRSKGCSDREGARW